MGRIRHRWTAATAAVVVLLAACTGDEGPSERAPEDVREAAAEWALPNFDYSNTRSARSDIDSGNVEDLGVAWQFSIPGVGAYGAAASNPLIANNVVYLQDLASNVFALDLEDGAVRWERRYDVPVVGPNGPALGDGRLVVHSGASSVSALSLDGGDEEWRRELEHPTGSHQPVVWDGTIYTGTAAGEVIGDRGEGEIGLRGYAGGTSGFAYALDEETGDTEWRFQVVQEGFWGNPEVNSGGGIWYPPAIDEERGLTYWGTGNPAPFPGVVDFPNASSRPGPNLYTNSIVALEADNGDLAWHRQVKPGDLFDLDFQAPRILATVETQTGERDIVIGSGKLGRVIAFDRDTGEEIWDRPVGEHQNDELSRIPEGETVTVLPGVLGGVETPMAYEDGTVFVPVLNLATPYTATAFGAETGTEAVGNAESRLDFSEATGEVLALDAATGRIRWRYEVDDALFSGATVVNDLVFVATYGGRIIALSRDDGGEVWSYDAPGGINAWPAVAGDTIVWPVGVGNEPVLLALRLGAEGGRTVEPTAGPSPTERDDEGQAGEEVSLEARNVSFGTDEITLSAGADVTMQFTNHDSVPHNFAAYQSDAANEDIFVGEVITGPDAEVTYTFAAPQEPGTYFFRCDVHPQQMTGDLVVE